MRIFKDAPIMKQIILIITSTAILVLSLTSCGYCRNTTPNATVSEEWKGTVEEVITEALQTEEEHYQDYYDLAVAEMLAALIVAEEMCNLELAVWWNSIYQADSAETDPYTKNENGYFYESFDDALNNLYNSDEYQSLVEELISYEYDVEQALNEVRTPPDSIDDIMQEALVDYYVEYQSFISLALYSTNESYNSFSEKFSELEETSIDAYNRAHFYTASF